MEVMGGPSSVAYAYDWQGRVTQTRQQRFNVETTISTTYNEHGDKAVEITRCAQIGGQNGQRLGLPSYSEVRYSYEYDDLGNWTEETVSYRSGPDEAFSSSSGRQRKLTYY